MPKRKPKAKPKAIKKPVPKRKKLTPKLKEQIKAAKGSQPLKNFDGEALAYLRKYKTLQKAREVKASLVLKINGVKIPRNSDIYKIATSVAKRNGTTVNKLSATDMKAIEALNADGRLFFNREVEYIKEDIKNSPSKTVIHNDKAEPKETVLLRLVRMKNKAVPEARLYPYLNIEYFISLTGVINIKFPRSSEYRSFINLGDEQETIDSWRDLLDKYDIGYTPND
jgi:hypothetical protein